MHAQQVSVAAELLRVSKKGQSQSRCGSFATAGGSSGWGSCATATASGRPAAGACVPHAWLPAPAGRVSRGGPSATGCLPARWGIARAPGSSHVSQPRAGARQWRPRPLASGLGSPSDDHPRAEMASRSFCYHDHVSAGGAAAGEGGLGGGPGAQPSLTTVAGRSSHRRRIPGPQTKAPTRQAHGVVRPFRICAIRLGCGRRRSR